MTQTKTGGFGPQYVTNSLTRIDEPVSDMLGDQKNVPRANDLKSYSDDELERMASEIRRTLCGRPVKFKLSREDNAIVVSAIVPSYYSRQLLLRAAQKATASVPIKDRICVPIPDRAKR